MENPYHYDLVKRAIGLIERHGGPWSLEEIAAQMEMSSSHFQRVFTKWVRVSPKTYQQYLRLDYAKERLLTHHTTLDAAHDAGLSGTSRLYDLFIKWEAMTPGEFARKGAGLDLAWAKGVSPFGPVIAMASARGLCGLGFVPDGENGTEEAFDDLARRWPKARYVHNPARIEPLINAAFAHHGTLELHLSGSPFHVQVWQALLRIPAGSLTTYSDVAMATGRPQAQRAVGSAIGRNPVSYFIPCHRALRKNGELGGYHWGMTTKRAILAYEGARNDADPR